MEWIYKGVVKELWPPGHPCHHSQVGDNVGVVVDLIGGCTTTVFLDPIKAKKWKIGSDCFVGAKNGFSVALSPRDNSELRQPGDLTPESIILTAPEWDLTPEILLKGALAVARGFSGR